MAAPLLELHLQTPPTCLPCSTRPRPVCSAPASQDRSLCEAPRFCWQIRVGVQPAPPIPQPELSDLEVVEDSKQRHKGTNQRLAVPRAVPKADLRHQTGHSTGEEPGTMEACGLGSGDLCGPCRG